MRIPVKFLSLTAAGLVAIALHEGFRDTAYIPVPGDVPTIGFGTTEGVKMGDKISVETALQRKLNDVNKFEGAVKKCVNVPLHQYEYDAYISFSYNVGEYAFCKSTLVKKLNQAKYDEACAELKKWVYSKGVKYQGLVNRREKEYQQCLGY